jgi:hypothetical protein
MREVTLPELQDYMAMVPEKERKAVLKWATNYSGPRDYSWVKKKGLEKHIKVKTGREDAK